MPKRQLIVITERASVRTVEVTRASIKRDEQESRPAFSRTVIKAFGESIVSQQRQAVPGARDQTCLERVIAGLPSVLCVRNATPLDIRTARLDIARSWRGIVDADELC